MKPAIWIGGLLAVASVVSIVVGEVDLTAAQWREALGAPGSSPWLVVWEVRAPRTVCAALVGGALGLAGAVMQGLLRNPLADPGVLGVSAVSATAAAFAIVLGLALIPGVVEGAALVGALGAGAALIAAASRLRSPEALILFGVALSSFAGALTALIFNLSPTPIATQEVMNWLLGGVQNRSWWDVVWVGAPLAGAALLAARAAPGLRMLTLGEETAQTSGLPMRRLRLAALAATALAAGGATAAAGVIGFVGLAAPHLVRTLVRGDPGRVLLPSALAGALILTLADILARRVPTEQELRLGVITALIGAPLFALIAWRAAREWRL
ncbi:FecCD family ABC transporter permease [Brevundimonas balnearis]|uniref:FecCD family ABC transporter permease n=1 Tax=Brevundimonas balnearis TaxID=1572858 RepID=A0ABV6R1N5_9CAUL